MTVKWALLRVISIFATSLLALMPVTTLYAQQQSDVFDVPGSHTFTVPAGVSQITVEVWGGGGKGGNTQGNNRAGGGGGAGGYAAGTVAVVPGDEFQLEVGSGGQEGSRDGESSAFGDDLLVALGGEGLVTEAGGAQPGGTGGAGIVDTAHVTNSTIASGDDGNDGQTGGGGSGGAGGDAPDGISADAGTGGSGGNDSDGNDGSAPGGGGGGGHNAPGGGGAARSGGSGGHGQVIITYDDSQTPPACEADADQPWADINWEFRKCFVIDPDRVEGALSGFPMLVSIDDNQIADAAQSSGADLFFTDNDGNRLPHEIERYDTGELEAWVRAPALSATDETLFYIYYGNDTAPDQQDVPGTWDDNYRLVQHLQELGNQGTPLLDSTSFGNDGSVTGASNRHPLYLTDGAINGARDHRGQTAESGTERPSLTFPHTSSLDITETLTAEAWARVEPNQPTPNHNPILWKGSRIGWGANYLFRIAVRSNTSITWGVTCGNNEAWFDGGAPVLDEWAHYAITFDGTTTRAYINGEQVATNTGCSGSTLNATSEPVKSGHAQQQGNSETYFRGGVDEVRMSAVARSQPWLRTQYNNISAPNQFHFFGQQETAQDEVQTCFSDNFNRSDLGSDWVTSTSLGNFIPQIVEVAGSGRLRMTEAVNNQATAATLQRLIPAAGNRVELEFDYYAYGGSGADGLTIVLSDAEVTPQPGGYGGSLGYANRSGINGFAGGWLGIGLDEFGNFSNPTEGRNGGPGSVTDAVAVRGAGQGQSGYEYLVGTSSLTPGVDGTGETTPHRYRVTINSRTTGTTVLRIERDVGDGNGYQTLIEDFDVLNDASPGFSQSPVPDNFLLSLTGSTGGSNNIHEFGTFEICADELNPVDLQINHFEFDFPTSEGLTCEFTPVGLRACLDDDCAEQLTQPFNATLVPASGWADGNQIEGFTSGDSLNFLPPDEGTYSFDVSGSSPPTRPLAQPKCFINGVEQADCDRLFSDAGFQFFDAGNAATGLAELIAGETGEQLFARPVTTDPDTGVCTAVFDPAATVDVETGTVCDNPGSCSDGYQVSWILDDDTAIPLPNPDNTIGGEDTRNVAWSVDDNATTGFRLLSPDIGLQTLNLRYVPEDADGEPAPQNAITGSIQIRSRPAEIRLQEIRTQAGASNPEASAATGPVFARAGEPFTTEIMAVDIDGAITPGFSAIDGLFDVYWDDSTVLIPNGGAGSLTASGSNSTQASHWEPVAGDPGVIRMTDTAPPLRFNEVGIVRAQARIEAFLGGVDLISTETDIGRFIPAEFELQTLSGGVVSQNTGSFIYQGQPFGLSQTDRTGVLLTPRGWRADPAVPFSGSVTENYQNDLASLASAGSGEASLSNTGDAGGFVEPDEPQVIYEADADDPWLTQLFVEPSTTLRIEKIVNPDADQAPQTLQLSLQLAASALQDDDGVCYADADSTCLPYTLSDLNPQGLDLIYGRLRLRPTQGPVNRTLRLPLTLEFWDGNQFQTHTAAQSEASDATGALPDLDAGQFEALDAEGNALGGVSVTLPGALNGGEAELLADYSGATPVRARIRGTTVPLYLQFPWPYGLDDDLGEDDKGQFSGPQATASFGVYEGRPPMLFMLPQGR
ncbi:MAG: DUF2341 domain-containing protein [Natronospirillum sp.]|uniref:DUF2341 domain-containing protein n=1 Tax=Natronospirillum sp. TaxID=2812955 RepID=UPI0025F1CEEA|nr:DUF2341 domain-containing protein [Natronospirillum sp.]MCH8550815.1 DUF2341 domain-containing protein [Natronospirillum sp.]